MTDIWYGNLLICRYQSHIPGILSVAKKFYSPISFTVIHITAAGWGIKLITWLSHDILHLLRRLEGWRDFVVNFIWKWTQFHVYLVHYAARHRNDHYSYYLIRMQPCHSDFKMPFKLVIDCLQWITLYYKFWWKTCQPWFIASMAVEMWDIHLITVARNLKVMPWINCHRFKKLMGCCWYWAYGGKVRQTPIKKSVGVRIAKLSG